jgi:hypothetical protein
MLNGTGGTAVQRKRKLDDSVFSNDETSRRRDEVIRRMVNTPPQPKVNAPRRQGKKKKTGAGRAAGKGRARHEG